MSTPPPPTGSWYFVITVLSCGLLGSVPVFHAASRLHRPRLHAIGAGLAAVAILAFTLIALSPVDETGSATGWSAGLGASLMLGAGLVATLLLIGLRRKVYGSGRVDDPVDRNAAARAGVEQARRKREEARALAARDPLMARELGVGRSWIDGRMGYDDGGLIDLNLAEAEHLVAACGMPRAFAEQVIAARARLGGFVSVEDAIVYGEIPDRHDAVLRDRGIVIDDP
jgi:hypothetical protein